MITFEAESADIVWRRAASQVSTSGVVQDGRDQPTKELLHVACAIADPRQRLVFARPMNPAFAVAEVIWILAGANDTEFLRFWNPRMARFTDEGQPAFHGAYGYRLGSQPRLHAEVSRSLRHKTRRGAARFDQLRAAYEVLRRDPNSRQVVLQIWDSTRDMPNPNPRSRDVPCNIASHLLVRSGRMEWLQVMRSTDLMWGLPYNFVQFTTMQEIMAGWLDIDVGSYHHISDSLHVYRRHWESFGTLNTEGTDLPQNRADLRISSFREWERLWARLVDCTRLLAQHADVDRLLSTADAYRDVPPAYAEWVALLAAEALRRRGHQAAADEIVTQAGSYWTESWRLWAAAVAKPSSGRG